MKLAEALFKAPWQAYQVSSEYWEEDWDNFGAWDLQPLTGQTLAPEDVDGPFEGLFIIAAQLVTADAAPQPCYLDLVLPERIVEHYFLQTAGRITRGRGRRVLNGTMIPSIGIEKLGDYTLFFAKEDPSAGINVLTSGINKCHRKEYLADDLAHLLRDQKRYEEAIDAFSIVLSEAHNAEILPIVDSLYKQRAQLYAAIGQSDQAEEDRRQYALAFEKKYGHAPGPHEM